MFPFCHQCLITFENDDQEGVAIEIAEAVVGALKGELASTAVNAPMVSSEVLGTKLSYLSFYFMIKITLPLDIVTASLPYLYPSNMVSKIILNSKFFDLLCNHIHILKTILEQNGCLKLLNFNCYVSNWFKLNTTQVKAKV